MKNISMIIDQFDVSIRKIEKSNLTVLTKLKQKINTTQDCLNELRQEVKSNSFSSSKKEIHFFKHQKPYIKGRLRFYININNYLLEKPVGSKSKLRNHINLQLSKLESENYKYLDFIKYFRLEETKLDHIYFLRGVNQLEFFIDSTSIFEDPEFRTTRDHLSAKIIAHDLLTQFYTNELESFKKNKDKYQITEVKQLQSSDLSWTGSKTDCVELAYSLCASRAINNGDIDMKKIIKQFEIFFNINLGNFYKTYHEIKEREKDPTRFLQKLTIDLSSKIKLENQK